MNGIAPDISGMVVEEINVCMHEFRAAMMFVEGKDREAESFMASVIRNHKKDAHKWDMLFDLYRILNDRNGYDNLAMEYATIFGVLPDNFEPLTHEEEEEAVTVVPSVTLEGIMPIVQTIKESDHKSHAFDLTNVKKADTQGITMLDTLLMNLAKKGDILRVVDTGNAFLNIISNNAIKAGKQSRQSWGLVFTLMSIYGMEKEHESFGGKFLDVFEEMPPVFIKVKSAIKDQKKATGNVMKPVPGYELVKANPAANETWFMEMIRRMNGKKVALSYHGILRISHNHACIAVQVLGKANIPVAHANAMVKSVFYSANAKNRIKFI